MGVAVGGEFESGVGRKCGWGQAKNLSVGKGQEWIRTLPVPTRLVWVVGALSLPQGGHYT